MAEAAQAESNRKVLQFAMGVSLVIGVLMFFMKTGAYLLTGSAAILSDAADSVVHVAAVCFAFYSLRISYKPADREHLYGHAKISFFSAGFEGAMIILAALYIICESLYKWIIGLHLENLGLGTLITAAAAIINGALGAYLLWVGRRNHSLIVQADGKHVLTDCWTSAAVLVGLGLTLTTGWLPWDPICGIVMALNILISGIGLIRSAFSGLMDTADPKVHRQLQEILKRETAKYDISFHALRHRSVGDSHWVELHFLFPEGTSIGEAHRTATSIEKIIEQAFAPHVHVTSHLECLTDHAQLHAEEETEREQESEQAR